MAGGGGLLMLLLLCVVMGIASFLAGILPLSFTLSQRQLRLITALGTGVLVGTSLIVIIPEGVETLYSAGEEGGHGLGNERRADGLVSRSTVALGEPSAVLWIRHGRRDDVLDSLGVDGNIAVWDTTEQSSTDDSTAAYQATDESDQGIENEKDDHDHAGPEPHAWVGLSLVSGFVLMYLVDTLPRALASSQTQPRRFSISLTSLSFNRSSDSTAEAETPTQDSFPDSVSKANSPKPNSTTLGLLIHATADGIALGASSASNTNTGNRLTLVIFLALMLHKAPAAFGLTAVLLKQGLSKRMARAHLIVFSLAAPVGAIGTWIVAKMFSGPGAMSGREPASTQFATGVLLLFSGGTFLYVAVHTMLETSSGGHEHGAHGQADGNGYLGLGSMDAEEEGGYGVGSGNAGKNGAQESGGVVDVLVTVAGMLLPLLTGLGGHGH